MGIGNLGYAVNGLATGFNSGLDMAAKLDELRKTARMRAAQRAVGQAYLSGADFGGGDPSAPQLQPPAPGEASLPKGATGPDPMMGTSPIPQGSAPPLPPSMGGAPPPVDSSLAGAPGPAGPVDAAPSPPAAAPAPQPAPAPGPTGSGSGAPAPDVPPEHQPLSPEAQSSITEANNAIKGFAQAIKSANPNIDPETLFNAVEQHVTQLKGVRNEVKDYMVAQTALARAQYGVQNTAMKVAGQLQVANTRADAARDVAGTNAEARTGSAQIRADASRDVAQTGAGARIGAAQIGAGSREAVAQTGAGSRRYAADKRYQGQVYQSVAGAASRADSARVGAQGRVDAAGVGMGQPAPNRGYAPVPAGVPGAPPRPPAMEGEMASGPTGTFRGVKGRWVKVS